MKDLERTLYELPKALKIVKDIVEEIESIRQEALKKAEGKFDGKIIGISVDCRIYFREDGRFHICPLEDSEIIYTVRTGTGKTRRYIIVDGFPVKVGKIGKRIGKVPEWMRKYPKLEELLYRK